MDVHSSSFFVVYFTVKILHKTRHRFFESDENTAGKLGKKENRSALALSVAISLCEFGEFGFVFSKHAHVEGLISSANYRTLLLAGCIS